MSKDFLERNRKNVIIAGLIFFSYILLHLIFQRHELMAYDMYTYSSFIEHYSENWFYTILSGQAHGLEIVSYPPLLFQIMALLSFIPLVNQTSLYILMMSAGVTAFSFSFYILLRELLNLEDDKHNLLILLIAFSPGLLKFSLVHGQLPLIIGMTFGFLSASFFYRALHGKETRIYLATCLLLTAYLHHFSFLITLLTIGCISILYLRTTISKIEYLMPPLAVSAALIAIGLYPMIQESIFGISQGVIFHGSRDPFRSLILFNQYITSTFGATIAGILLIFKKNSKHQQVNILALLFLTLGLGLATPTAEILFGNTSTFIVYDRFSLVSSLFLTGLIGYYLIENKPSVYKIDIRKVLVGLFVITSLATVFWANNLHLGSYTGYGEYDKEETETAIQYLNENASQNYLYTTVDHHPPIGEIRKNTRTPTLDTGYFQGRKHGILKNEGKFDRLEEEEFRKIIDNADEVSLKYILIFDDEANSWFRTTDNWDRKNLDNGVTVWINPDAEEYDPTLGQKRILFGTMPLLILVSCICMFSSVSLRRRIETYFDQLESYIKRVSRYKKSRKQAYIGIFLLPLIAAAPSLLTSGYPAGIDTPAHIFKPELMAHMINHYGQIFYWTDQWYNGYPFMSMYPPISASLIYGLYSLLGNITVAYNLVRLAAITSLSGVLYLLSGNITEDYRIRIITSAFGVFSYPIYSNLYTVGRLASALALPLYLFMIHILLREDIFQKDLSRGHIWLGISAGILFLLHSMMAYLFIFTGLIFCLVYWKRVVKIGVKPVGLILLIPLVICLPYLARLLQHFSITDPSWYVQPRNFSIFKHLKLNYEITPPTYTGLIQTLFFLAGILKIRKLKNKFLIFLLANFTFFYTAFWARNFRMAYFLPLSRQFDLARFEILFVAFGVLIAAYGLKYFFNTYLSDISRQKKNLVAALLVIFVFLQSSPMLIQSANWEPNFKDDMNMVELEDDYRAIGVDMRQWHTYLLWEMDVKNTFGWFNQANPNPLYTQSLQRSGGRWHGWYFVRDIGNPQFRENLLELSNTKYIISAEGEWMDKKLKQQVKGLDYLNHRYNEELIAQIEENDNFSLKFSSENLDVYEFERDMSYCEGIKPIWIQEDYNRKVRELLQKDKMLPELPIEGEDDPREEKIATGVTCSKASPYNISVSVEDEGWVLVKESYYPFWKRKNGVRIYDGFGFMVTYVEDGAELRYKPRSLSTLETEDIKALFT